jgi:hypothetical protein
MLVDGFGVAVMGDDPLIGEVVGIPQLKAFVLDELEQVPEVLFADLRAKEKHHSFFVRRMDELQPKGRPHFTLLIMVGFKNAGRPVKKGLLLHPFSVSFFLGSLPRKRLTDGSVGFSCRSKNTECKIKPLHFSPPLLYPFLA